ncbi:MAG: hypothetical protein NVSMB44_26820 [Ktedonobacteraceae bacterium]
MTCSCGRSYTIKSGDTLSLIAERELGDKKLWPDITKPDGTHFTATEAKVLQIGQEICLPAGNTTPAPLGFKNILSRSDYEAMFPQHDGLYTYSSFARAVEKYPQFCNEGSLAHCKREMAAFLANVAYETGSLRYVEELGADTYPPTRYCQKSSAYPCVPGQKYHGRGPLQLSWNYNYGAAGQALGLDLLADPGLVASNGVISFQAALWFWMTPQPPKPSPHAVMNGGWTPSPLDIKAGRVPGFGMTINIINGGSECGKPTPPQVMARVDFYERFTSMLHVDKGNNLYCNGMAHY